MESLAKKYDKGPVKLLLLMAMWLVGCTTTTTEDLTEQVPPATEVSAAATPNDPQDSDHSQNKSASELNDQLLYDILLASIAGQRQKPEVALEALSRAVYQSRNRRLAANAIQLALQLKDYQKVIQFSRLLLSQDPNNHLVILSLANAQINSDKLDEAGQTLIELIKKQTPGSENVLQQIAGLIARQQPATQSTFQDLLKQESVDNNLAVIFTSAVLASYLEQSELFDQLLEQILTLQPAWEIPAIMKLTRMTETKQSQQEIEQWAESFLKNNPESNRFRTQFARSLIRNDKLEQAADQLNLALKQNPDYLEALFTAAVVHMDLKKIERAEKLFTQYISKSDNGDQARLYLAQMYIDGERYAEASPYLRQIQSNQYYLDAQIALSGVIAKLSNVDAGLSHLRNIDVRGEEESVQIILAQDTLLRSFDQMERSLSILSTALIERPGQPDLLYSRGLLAAQLNNIDMIEKDMRLLIELQPENAHAYNALGYTLADQTERFDEALLLIQKALEFRPEDPFILDSMGWVHYRIGDFDKALEFLERAIELKPDPEIAAHLGEVLWISGDKKQARKIWDQGIQLSPENTTLLKTIDRFLDHQADQRAVLPSQWVNFTPLKVSDIPTFAIRFTV